MAAFSTSDAAFEGFRVISSKPKAYLAWAGLFFVVSALAAAAFVHVAGDDFMTLQAISAEEEPDLARHAALFERMAPVLVVMMAAGMAAYAVIATAILRATLRPAEREPFHLALGATELRQFGVTALLNFALFLVVFATVVVSSALATANVMLGLAAQLAGVGFVGYVMARLSLALPASFSAGRIVGLFSAWRLSSKAGWSLFGAYVLAGALTVVIAIVALIAVMAAFAGGLDPETLRGLMEPDTSGLATYFTPYRWVVQAVSALLWSFAYVMIVGASAHAYRAIALERGEHP
ncbi:MAG: hypothetical protein AB7M12_02910 [Hyphomonadaceae bacterium]